MYSEPTLVANESVLYQTEFVITKNISVVDPEQPLLQS